MSNDFHLLYPPVPWVTKTTLNCLSLRPSCYLPLPHNRLNIHVREYKTTILYSLIKEIWSDLRVSCVKCQKLFTLQCMGWVSICYHQESLFFLCTMMTSCLLFKPFTISSIPVVLITTRNHIVTCWYSLRAMHMFSN